MVFLPLPTWIFASLLLVFLVVSLVITIPLLFLARRIPLEAIHSERLRYLTHVGTALAVPMTLGVTALTIDLVRTGPFDHMSWTVSPYGVFVPAILFYVLLPYLSRYRQHVEPSRRTRAVIAVAITAYLFYAVTTLLSIYLILFPSTITLTPPP